jgi:hypothetical protein
MESHVRFVNDHDHISRKRRLCHWINEEVFKLMDLVNAGADSWDEVLSAIDR